MEEEGWLNSLLLLAGGGTLLYWTLRCTWITIQLFRSYVWARMVKDQQPWTTRFGQWAVVTGASDGIGKAYVHKLAERGMNVILIARNKDKLDIVTQNVSTAYGIETSVIVADFGEGRPIYDHIAKELGAKDIGVLVNNVGVLGQYYTLFTEWEDKSIWDIVNINVASVPCITKLVLPGMLQRHRGVIINISSLASVMPAPMAGLYNASKAFVDFFSQALSVECEGTGVLIQGVHPGYVHSNITKPFTDHTDMKNIPSFLFPTTEVFVESALSTVGYTDYTHGYWGHSVHRLICEFLMALPFKAGSRYVMKKSMKKREQMNKVM